MAANDSTTLRFARAAATIGLGLAAGYTGGLHYWSQVYDAGAKQMVSLLVPTAASCITSSVLASQSPVSLQTTTNWIARNRKEVWAVCAAGALAVPGFTLVAIMKVVKQLKKAEQEIRKG
ncbi:hypothetical protein ACM66B_006050 [Microbotryomycetes sp. NB124-2]